MTDFDLYPLGLKGLCLVGQKQFTDHRGRFARLFCQTRLNVQGKRFEIRQINHSRTVGKGSVRGLHFQHAPHAESKLITCLAGSIWDVAVDLRPGSPTFLQWHAEELAANDGRSLLIPAGFAHGFQVLSDEAQILYCSDADYTPADEAGLSPNDAALAISWPLPVSNLSARDAAHPPIDASFAGVRL